MGASDAVLLLSVTLANGFCCEGAGFGFVDAAEATYGRLLRFALLLSCN
jgi:hypothetical protein